MVARATARQGGFVQRGRVGPLVSAWLVSAALVFPLIAAEAPSGFRLGVTDIARAVLSSAEQPLSARSLVGDWVLALVAAWFVLWLRGGRWWEATVVAIAGAIVLARTGNAWLTGILLVAPLAIELRRLAWTCKPLVVGVAVVGSVLISLGLILVERPRPIAAAALAAARQAPTSGSTLAHWAWAPELQSDFGRARPVLAAGGLSGESEEFWIDYLRVAQGHERWATILTEWNVNLVVLDAANQEHKAAALVRESADWQVVYDAEGTLIAERVVR